MNLRTLTTSALALGLVIPATGCFETIAGPYDGPTVVEFAQFVGSADPYARIVGEDAGTVELTVNLIGPQQGSDTVVQVAVDESLSTADAGSDYTFPNGAQVTIPANSSSGTLQINVLDDGDDDGGNETIFMELTGTADGSIEGADNFDDFALTITDND
jgi:hypothetical protein